MTVLTVSPVVLEIPGRPVDLQLKVSAPTEGSELPIILLSHGQGHSNHLSSLNGYALAFPSVHRLNAAVLSGVRIRGTSTASNK